MITRLNTGVINGLIFQVTWFSTIFLASQERANLAAIPGVIFTLLLFAQSRLGQTVKLLIKWCLIGLVLGYFCEQSLINLSVFIPLEDSALGVPFWLLSLWGALFSLISQSMSWVLKKPFIAISFGTLGAPLSYLSGAHLGAMNLGESELIVGLYTGGAWAIAMGVSSYLWRLDESKRD